MKSVAKKSTCSFKNDQVYSNTRVPTQVNTSQHESTSLTLVRHESTRINTSLKQVDMSPTQVNTNQHKSKSVLDKLT